MPNRTTNSPSAPDPLQFPAEQQALLMRAISGEVPPSEGAVLLQGLRQQNPESSAGIDAIMLQRTQQLYVHTKNAEKIQAKLKEKIEELGAEPFFPASFVGPIEMQSGRLAIVEFNGNLRIVSVDSDAVTLDDLEAGDDVLLGHELNIIRGRMPDLPKGGELAPFSRRLDDGRLMIKGIGDEEIVVRSSPRLDDAELSDSDLIRYSKTSHTAYEAIPAPAAEDNSFFLDDIPAAEANEFADRAGHLKRIVSALSLSFDHDVTSRYGLSNTNILMHGPPGCGKTTTARVAVSRVSGKMGEPIRVALINGAAFENEFVGRTQRNIDNFFADVREAAADTPVVVVWDEAEAAGRTRGGHCRHSDKFLNTLLGQLDGFRQNEKERIAFIFLTNRVDNMDNAFYERITNGGFELSVTRPGMSDAREILATKLAEAPSLPYNPNGSRESENRTRDELIETAISLLFSPNGPNRICTVKTNDGADHEFRARDLISGRVLNQIAAQTRRSAAETEAAGHERGLTVDHVREAVAEAVHKMRAAISPANAHAYLPTLPTDLAVTAVIPAEPDAEPVAN